MWLKLIKMIALLTNRLLLFLKGRGYRFMHTETLVYQAENQQTFITLSPALDRPIGKGKTLNDETFFAIDDMPYEWFEQDDDKTIVVSMGRNELAEYACSQ